jgi:hypothetical protein
MCDCLVHIPVEFEIGVAHLSPFRRPKPIALVDGRFDGVFEALYVLFHGHRDLPCFRLSIQAFVPYGDDRSLQ